jgi:hypothetical protein
MLNLLIRKYNFSVLETNLWYDGERINPAVYDAVPYFDQTVPPDTPYSPPLRFGGDCRLTIV